MAFRGAVGVDRDHRPPQRRLQLGQGLFGGAAQDPVLDREGVFGGDPVTGVDDGAYLGRVEPAGLPQLQGVGEDLDQLAGLVEFRDRGQP